MLRVKRIYEQVSEDDGYRVLVDGLWPRGMRKDEAGLDEWLKAIAPSAELRKEFGGHDPEKWPDFQVRYAAELDGKAEVVEHLRRLSGEGTVTLLYAARDAERNNAVALKAYLEKAGGGADGDPVECASPPCFLNETG